MEHREGANTTTTSWFARRKNMEKEHKFYLYLAMLALGALIEKGPFLPFFGPLISGISLGLMFHLASRYWVRRIGTYIIGTAAAPYLAVALFGAGSAVLTRVTLLALIIQDVYRYLHRNTLTKSTGAISTAESIVAAVAPSQHVKLAPHRGHEVSEGATEPARLENKSAWRAFYVLYLVAAICIVLLVARGLTDSFLDSQPYPDGGSEVFIGYALIFAAVMYCLYRFILKRTAAYIVYGSERLKASLSYSVSVGWAIFFSMIVVAIGLVFLLSVQSPPTG